MKLDDRRLFIDDVRLRPTLTPQNWEQSVPPTTSQFLKTACLQIPAAKSPKIHTPVRGHFTQSTNVYCHGISTDSPEAREKDAAEACPGRMEPSSTSSVVSRRRPNHPPPRERKCHVEFADEQKRLLTLDSATYIAFHKFRERLILKMFLKI